MNIEIYLFIACFIAHELEEVMLLPPWLRHHRHKLAKILPSKLQPVLSISRTGFAVIALWEGMIIATVSLLLPESAWWFGMVAAYTLHLLLHCGQFFMLKKYGLPVPKLITVPLELPLCFYILSQSLSVAPVTSLIFASVIWTAFAAVNLATAHAIYSYSRKR
ncbi:HXXEE domain-containing protein [Cardiobacteriaceae bacterium TAE3-ERU3]|nr:HXXEE domain-containing protein [Cardiobacteriaceae bacterium TAE3-ERU3]